MNRSRLSTDILVVISVDKERTSNRLNGSLMGGRSMSDVSRNRVVRWLSKRLAEGAVTVNSGGAPHPDSSQSSKREAFRVQRALCTRYASAWRSPRLCVIATRVLLEKIVLSTHEFLDTVFENGAFAVGGYIPALRDGSFPTGVSEEPVGTMGEVSVWYADKCNFVDLDDGIFKRVANNAETINFALLNVRSRNLRE